jgi:hypothetical protein
VNAHSINVISLFSNNGILRGGLDRVRWTVFYAVEMVEHGDSRTESVLRAILILRHLQLWAEAELSRP